jgi:hypothetical protein
MTGRADLKELAEAYHLLDDAERLQLRQSGSMASRVHRAGGLAFGRPMRIVRAKLERQLAMKEIQVFADMEPASRSLEVCKKFDGSQSSLAMCLKFVRQCNRLDFKRLRVEAEHLETGVVDWEAQLGSIALQNLRKHLPTLAEVPLQVIPCVAGDCFALMPNPDDAVHVLALTSASAKIGSAATGFE